MNPCRGSRGQTGGIMARPVIPTPVFALIFILFLLGGCGGTRGPEGQEPDDRAVIDLWPAAGEAHLAADREGCGILAGPSTPGGHFVFCLTDSVHPGHAPVPRNTSERLLFAQLYETLVRVDCNGETRPGLAESWTSSADHMVWTFTLREGARFWDGSRITAVEVQDVFARDLEFSVRVLDEQRLAFRLGDPHPRFPRLLAHPARAVSVPRPGWTWRLGSGPCRLRASDPAPLPDLTCLPNQNHPDRPVWKSLTFRVLPETDPRDLVATDMDLALVRETDVAGFFDGVPGFHSVPLPWNRLYLLVCPPGMNPQGSGRWIAAADRFDAGRDVTAVSARAWPEILFPAGGLDLCPQLYGPVRPPGSAKLDWNLAGKNLDRNVLVYPGEDAGAREMAHRLGALAGGQARTAAVPTAGIDFVLQWQMAGAVLVAIDQDYPTGCRQMATLLGKADWLQQAALGPRDQPAETLAGADRIVATPPLPPTEALTGQDLVRPLGLSRPWLVMRGALAGIDLAFDGTPLLAGLGKAAEAAPGEATP